MIGRIRKCFEGLKDPRTQCPALKHDYVGVLCLVGMAMSSGANGPTDVVRYWLNMAGHRRGRRFDRCMRALRLAYLPSHDQIGRIMAVTDPADLDRAVQAAEALQERRRRKGHRARPRPHRRVAVDGKANRGSASPVNGRDATSVVNAVDVDTKRVLATVMFPAPGQEPPTARDLLRRPDLCLDGALVSLDAAHCCRETLALISQLGGDWLVPVKANVPAVQAEILSHFSAQPSGKAVTICGKGHGRRERRIGETVTNRRVLARIAATYGYDGLATLGRVTYITQRRGKPTTHETCVFICSRKLTPRELLTAVREHWGVEVLHNHLDVSFDEDGCRIRTGFGSGNFSIMRRYAFGILDSLRLKGESLRAAMSRLTCTFAVLVASEEAM